jgi:hypothetical protein
MSAHAGDRTAACRWNGPAVLLPHQRVESLARRPALTAPARDAPEHARAGTKEQPYGTNKGTALIRREQMT